MNQTRKQFLFLAFAVVDFFAAIEITAFIVATPRVAEYFSIGFENISWIINSYLYAVFATLVLFYFISKKIKHTANIKTFFIFGLGLFLLGSIFGGISTNAQMFYASRVIQGIGAAISFVGQLWMMTYSFRNEIEKPLFWTETGAAAGVILGPFLGGIFSDLGGGGWKLLFLFNVVVVLMAIIITALFYKKTSSKIIITKEGFRKDFYFAMVIIVVMIAVAVAGEFVVSVFLQRFENYSGLASGMVMFFGSVGLVVGSARAVKNKNKKKKQIRWGLFGMLATVLFMGFALQFDLLFLAPFSFFALGFFYGFLNVALYSYVSHMLSHSLLVEGVTIYLIATQVGNATGIYVEKIWRFFDYDFLIFAFVLAISVWGAIVLAKRLAELENIEGDLYEVAPLRKTPFVWSEKVIYFFQVMFFVLVLLPFRYVMNIRGYGLENVKFKNNLIFVANHSARLDLWALLSVLDLRSFMKIVPLRIAIAEGYYRMWPLKYFFNLLGVYPIKSKGELGKSLEDTLKHLDRGHSLAFFPEGHMLKKDEVCEPKKGIGYICANREVHILPAKIFYRSYNLLKRGRLWGARIVFGDMVHSLEIRKNNHPEKLHHAVMDRVYGLEKEAKKFFKKKLRQFAEVLEYSKEGVQHVIKTHRSAFPEGFHYDDAEDFFDKTLKNKENINILLKEGNDVVGLLIARPHNDVHEELKDDDKHMKPHAEKRYYIETMGVLPEYRGKFGHLLMTHEVIKEAQKRGVRNFSMHVRKENGLSCSLQQLFGKKLTHIREIDSWKWADGEPYHYVEGTFNRSLLTLSLMINSFIAFQILSKKIKKIRSKIKTFFID